MSGTGNGLAVRNGSAPAQHTGSAVAIRSNQSEFDDRQKAALVAMGVSEKATRAELAVFFHQCRNTQLDPFLKQIYLIHRRAKEGDKWVDKPTIQTGIDGFRVIRDRIADKKGQRVEYEDTVWYDEDRNPYDVWVWDEPAAACKVVVLVDGRRFPAVLRFNEYCQKNKDGDRLGRWRDGHAHQIEKCAEADALRKAFPNDMAGLILEDAAPLSDPDAPDRLPSDRPRVSAEQARARAPQHVDAEIVDEQDVPPAAPEPPVSGPADAPAEVAAAGGTPRATDGQCRAIAQKLTSLGVTDPAAVIRTAGLIAGQQVERLQQLHRDKAGILRQKLDGCDTPEDLDLLRAEAQLADDPRGDGEPGE
jgi:phage recombination protein Bet